MALYNALLLSAEAKLREFATGPYGEVLALPSGEPHRVVSVYYPQAEDFHVRGGRAQELYDREHIETFPQVAASGHSAGEEIRLIDSKLPMKLLIVDDHTALVPLGPYGHPCLLIRDRGLVATFTTFFELKWAQGEPWAPPGTPTPTKDDTQRQRILDALAAGLKDEAIARELSVSVRTVRRHITALMQQLGASTRFAAGVAAVRRGWVTRPS